MNNNTNVENRISVIIPARCADYLLFESISKIRVLYPFVKIVIVLDEIDENKIKDFDKNIIVLKSENINMSEKRNQGVNIVNTEYIGFIDSDAYPNEHWIEKAVKFLDKNTKYSAVTGNQFLPQEDNFQRQCLRLVRFCRIFTYPQWCKIIDKTAPEQDCEEFMTSNLIMRKATYDILGGMNKDIYLAEDNEFASRMTANGYKIRFVPEISVFHHECELFPFLRKIFCMSYYYSQEFVYKKGCKTLKEYISIFFPLAALFFVLFSFLIDIYFNKALLLSLFIPILVIILFIKEAFNLSTKLQTNKFFGFLFIFCVFIMFCVFWVSGTVAGLFQLPFFNVQKSYKHY